MRTKLRIARLASVLSLLPALAASCHKAATDAGAQPCPCTHGASDAATDGAAPCHHASAPAMPAMQPVPGRSVYQLTSTWQKENGETVALSVYRGQPTVVLMFYGTCQAVCPLLIGDMKRIEDALNPDFRARTRFLLVTFDPEHDTTERLHALAQERGLDPARWSLLRGTADDVRDLATVLGVQYRPTVGGQFSHSNVITLLDRDGVVAFQLEGVRQPVESMVLHIADAAGPTAVAH
ncbi:MAG: SCO family protein [Deltaproteobacteria bacterium]